MQTARSGTGARSLRGFVCSNFAYEGLDQIPRGQPGPVAARDSCVSLGGKCTAAEYAASRMEVLGADLERRGRIGRAH